MQTLNFSGNALRAARKRAGMSREWIAVQLGISANAIALWERGLTTPHANSLLPLADVLGVDVRGLYEPSQP